MKNKLSIFGLAVATVAISSIILYSNVIQNQNEQISYIPKRILPLQTGEEGIPHAQGVSSPCSKDLDAVKQKVPFRIMTPHVLPQGYTLQDVDFVSPDRVGLTYFDKPTCGSNAASFKDGILEIWVGPLDSLGQYKDGKAWIDNYMKSLQGMNTTTYTYVFNGRNAVAHPAGTGKSITINENNEVIFTQPYDTPSWLYIIDDNSRTIYSIRGHIPLEDIVAIAQSLQ